MTSAVSAEQRKFAAAVAVPSVAVAAVAVVAAFVAAAVGEFHSNVAFPQKNYISVY